MTDARVERARDLGRLALVARKRLERVQRHALDLNGNVLLGMNELGDLGDNVGLVEEDLELRRLLGLGVRKDREGEQANDQEAVPFTRVRGA